MQWISSVFRHGFSETSNEFCCTLEASLFGMQTMTCEVNLSFSDHFSPVYFTLSSYGANTSLNCCQITIVWCHQEARDGILLNGTDLARHWVTYFKLCMRITLVLLFSLQFKDFCALSALLNIWSVENQQITFALLRFLINFTNTVRTEKCD